MAAIADWCARTVLPGAGPPHPLGRAGAGTRFLPAWLRAALLYELTGAVMGKQGALAVLARGKAAMAPMASMLLLQQQGAEPLTWADPGLGRRRRWSFAGLDCRPVTLLHHASAGGVTRGGVFRKAVGRCSLRGNDVCIGRACLVTHSMRAV